MDKKYKIALIVLGVLLLSSAIGIVVYQLTKDKGDNIDDSTENENPDFTEYENRNQDKTKDKESELGGVGSSWSTTEVTPSFNAENEISNPIGELVGRVLYPKSLSDQGWGYSNIRTSAEVNNDQGWWDVSDNLITTINAGTSIGSVISETTGVYNGYSYRWFKVKLTKPTGGLIIDYTEGYVRGDTVTFQPYQI